MSPERDPFDDRRTCLECSNDRNGRCAQPVRAGIGWRGDLGDLRSMPQRCPAFVERPSRGRP